MADPLALEDFASKTDTTTDEIERFVAAGLLDLDGDGTFDDLDVMRLHAVLRHLEEGKDLATFRDDLVTLSDHYVAALFEDEVRYTIDEALERTGVPLEQMIGFATALGFGQDGVINADDIKMLELAKSMVDAGFPWEALIEGARVYADALRRVAEASLQMTHRYLCEPLVRAGRDEREVAVEVGKSVSVIGPAAETLLMHLHRVYMSEAALAHSASHLEHHDPNAPPGSMEQTIVFVDLSLFSSYTYLEGDEAAVEVIDVFDRTVRELAIAHKGRIVKQIGDEFMLIFREPAAAVRFAIALRDRSEGQVALRTGIHHGWVLYRLGDYWGNAVNVAARIVSMAMPNSILVTEPVAKAALGAGIEAEEIGVRSLRGMDEPLSLYRITKL